MTAQAFALTADGAHARTIKTARDIEHDVLAWAAGQMQKAAADRGPTGFPALVAAIDENNRHWTTSAVDLADPGNRIAQHLRGRLFHLAEFALRHGRKMRNGTASADALVDIDLAGLRGLRRQRTGA
jgi:flagellar biosynthesis activator protein FlaF